MFEPIALMSKCMDEGKDEKSTRIDFCNQLLEELKKMKGEDLEPCLSMDLDREERCANIVLKFFLCP
ncbi:MAG: hypothetical protein ACRDBM_10260 [Sporomusa sp.]